MSELFCCVLGYNNTVGKVSAQAKCPNQLELIWVSLAWSNLEHYYSLLDGYQSIMGILSAFHNRSLVSIENPGQRESEEGESYSHEWLRQNFSLQYQYNINQISDENKKQYQFGDN